MLDFSFARRMSMSMPMECWALAVRLIIQLIICTGHADDHSRQNNCRTNLETCPMLIFITQTYIYFLRKSLSIWFFFLAYIWPLQIQGFTYYWLVPFIRPSMFSWAHRFWGTFSGELLNLDLQHFDLHGILHLIVLHLQHFMKRFSFALANIFNKKIGRIDMTKKPKVDYYKRCAICLTKLNCIVGNKKPTLN